jgi:hypothetical protein
MVDVFAQLQLGVHRAGLQGLVIGITYYKINISNALIEHEVDSIAASASYAYHLNDRLTVYAEVESIRFFC